MIAFSLGEIVRYVGFVISLQRVARPEGTYTSIGQSVSISENMNTIIRNLEPQSEWLWIQSDDHVWEMDALVKLLERNVDIVVPLMVRRGPPFVAVVNREVEEDGAHVPFAYQDIPTDELFEVESAGTGGMLISRRVIDAIIDRQEHDRVFEVDRGDKLAEDYVFCRKAREAGFKIWCDPTVTVGHQGMFTVWPEVFEGRWRVRFDMGRNREGDMSTFYVDTQEGQ